MLLCNASYVTILRIHALASHLDTLDKQCEGRDDGIEPEDGVWWTYPEDGRTKQVLRWEMLAKRVSSNKH
uniref:Uncharacterized protein n=1 Tax=Setaria italica TaxID=4555 RepID=K4AHM6_SETIT